MSDFTEPELQWISDTAWAQLFRFRQRNAGTALTAGENAFADQLEHIATTAYRLLVQL